MMNLEESKQQLEQFLSTGDYSILNPALKKRLPEQKQGRNEPCNCGSGKKYKKCCGK